MQNTSAQSERCGSTSMTGNETHVGPLRRPVRVEGEAGDGYEKRPGFHGTDTNTGETRYGIFVAHEDQARFRKQATGKSSGPLRQRGVP